MQDMAQSSLMGSQIPKSLGHVLHQSVASGEANNNIKPIHKERMDS
jgi:hypothetical protein